MTRRKQIIEFALEFFEAGMDSQKFGMPSFDQIIEADYYKRYIDAILALPLDVPNSDEILSLAKKKGYYGNVPDAEINAFLKGALAVIIEIIKRNTKK